jgi:peroxiredoxin
MHSIKKQFRAHILSILLSLAITSSLAHGAGQPPTEGSQLPEITLPVPESVEHQRYLGIPDKGTFQISQIKAALVIMEIYSLYCPYCQREAPLLNDLYQAIEKDPNLKGKIKVIGIGAGNSSFEVNVFREKYYVPFPLFSDADFRIHKLLGETRTPYFIAVKIDSTGSHRVVYSDLGSIKSVDEFLKKMIKLSGL